MRHAHTWEFSDVDSKGTTEKHLLALIPVSYRMTLVIGVASKNRALITADKKSSNMEEELYYYCVIFFIKRAWISPKTLRESPFSHFFFLSLSPHRRWILSKISSGISALKKSFVTEQTSIKCVSFMALERYFSQFTFLPNVEGEILKNIKISHVKFIFLIHKKYRSIPLVVKDWKEKHRSSVFCSRSYEPSVMLPSMDVLALQG